MAVSILPLEIFLFLVNWDDLSTVVVEGVDTKAAVPSYHSFSNYFAWNPLPGAVDAKDGPLQADPNPFIQILLVLQETVYCFLHCVIGDLDQDGLLFFAVLQGIDPAFLLSIELETCKKRGELVWESLCMSQPGVLPENLDPTQEYNIGPPCWRHCCNKPIWQPQISVESLL